VGVWKKVVWRLREGEWSEEEKTRYGGGKGAEAKA